MKTAELKPTKRPLPEGFIEAIQARFGQRCSTVSAVLEQHGTDESPYPTMAPDAVVYAHDTDEVSWLAKHCHDHHVPLIPYGAGTSLEGHILAFEGGVCLDLSAMDAIVAIHGDDFTATVQAGVLRESLNAELAETGLFFPIDPGANATLGGMAATRASGTNAVRYGTMRDNILNLTVVMADGRVVRTGQRAAKSSAGYDLTRLFVGSEGTLGIITELTVRLHPLPEAVSAAVCHFPTVAAAVQTVIEVIQMGIDIARVEFMDVQAVRATNAYSKLDLLEQPLLLFEFHGSPTAVQEQAQLVQEIASANDGMGFDWAHQPEDRSRLWAARHQAYFAGLQLRPGAVASTTDVCVPISALASCVVETAQDMAQASFPSTILGHVGDGNFHVLMLLDPDNPAEWQESELLNNRIVQRALAADGTCTGEHGVGLHKRSFLPQEFGPEAIRVMRQIKHSLDPHNILNPGKIFNWSEPQDQSIN